MVERGIELAMASLRVLLFMLRLLPARDDADIALRMQIAEAIVAVTDDEHEQDLLAKIARYESSYRADVASCERKGPQREVTAWQILPRGMADRKALCVSLEGDAAIALDRIRESLTACRRLPEPERLCAYARGNCTSALGKRMSKARWVKREVQP